MTKLLGNYKNAAQVSRMIELREKNKYLEIYDPLIPAKGMFWNMLTGFIIWTIIILICIMLFSKKVEAWPDKFDNIDYTGQVLVTGLLIADWGQTTYASYNQKYYSETNPILGRKPDRDHIHTYFTICTIGHAAISYLLPKKVEVYGINIPARNIWQAVWIGIESNHIYSNYKIGVGWRF